MSVRSRGSRSRSVRVLAVACGVAAVATVVGGCAGDAKEDKHPDHRSFALEGRTLTVDSDDSALDLVPTDGDKVRVTRWFKGKVVLGGDPRVTWKMEDDRLTLRVKCNGVVADCSARHRIEVPRGIAVHVRDGDGRVTAKGFHSGLKLRTSDGSIRVEDSSGPLELQTGDGSVHATGVSSKQIKARTADGSLQLDLATAPDLVDTHTGDGSTTITLPRDGADGSGLTYKVTAKTGDGGIDIHVPRDDDSRHLVSATAGDGSVTVRNAD